MSSENEMRINPTLEERIARLEARLGVTCTKAEVTASNLDFVAMMTDTEIPEEEEDAQ